MFKKQNIIVLFVILTILSLITLSCFTRSKATAYSEVVQDKMENAFFQKVYYNDCESIVLQAASSWWGNGGGRYVAVQFTHSPTCFNPKHCDTNSKHELK